MGEENDMLGRLRAEMDQAKEGVREFAGMVWAFYDELITLGFRPKHALVLTLTFLQQTLAMQGTEDEDGGQGE